MAETPFAQEELAEATYCTVGLTWLPLAGAETETLAETRVDAPSASRRRRVFIAYSGRRVRLRTFLQDLG
jgi:hypothetical protein